ncbi:MAG: hypothetical protein R2749_13555 [Acidimicrobiales bacterium]
MPVAGTNWMYTRMAEDPEQVLTTASRQATGGRVEEPGAEAPVELQQQAPDDERGEGEQDHHRHDQHRPGEQRHAHQRHARCAHLEHADDDLEAGGDGAHLGHAEAEHPEVDGPIR